MTKQSKEKSLLSWLESVSFSLSERVLKRWKILKEKITRQKQELAKEKGWWVKWRNDKRVFFEKDYGGMYVIRWSNTSTWDVDYAIEHIEGFKDEFRNYIYEFYRDGRINRPR